MVIPKAARSGVKFEPVLVGLTAVQGKPDGSRIKVFFQRLDNRANNIRAINEAGRTRNRGTPVSG
jgi:hypothetical protein